MRWFKAFQQSPEGKLWTVGVDEAMSSQNTYIATSLGGSPEEWSELAHVVSIGGPRQTAEEIDVTHLRSAGSYREFIPSFKDGGEIPLALNNLPSNPTQNALLAEFQQDQPPTKRRRIFHPDGSTDTFLGWVKSFGTSEGVGQKSALDMAFRVTGPVERIEAGGSPV